MKFIEKIKNSYNTSKRLLLWVEISDIDKFKSMQKNTCMTHMHPIIKNLPESIRNKVVANMQETVDLIRDFGDIKYL